MGGSERNTRHGNITKRVKCNCRNSSAIFSYLPLYLPLLLLLLQLPATSSINITDLSLCHVDSTILNIAENTAIFIRPHENTTTLTLISLRCRLLLPLNISKEELITNHIEDVDGNLWGLLMYSLAPESINITLIGNSTVYPVQNTSCLAISGVWGIFNANSGVDAAYLKYSCPEGVTESGPEGGPDGGPHPRKKEDRYGDRNNYSKNANINTSSTGDSEGGSAGGPQGGSTGGSDPRKKQNRYSYPNNYSHNDNVNTGSLFPVELVIIPVTCTIGSMAYSCYKGITKNRNNGPVPPPNNSRVPASTVNSSSEPEPNSSNQGPNSSISLLNSGSPGPNSFSPGPHSFSPGPDSSSPGPNSFSPGPNSSSPEPNFNGSPSSYITSIYLPGVPTDPITLMPRIKTRDPKWSRTEQRQKNRIRELAV